MVFYAPSRLAAAALAVSLTACGGGTPASPSPTPTNPVIPGSGTVAGLTLVWPINGGYVQQNDAGIGCRYDPFFGYGFKVPFEWTPVAGASHYDIELKNEYASIPLLAQRVAGPRYDYFACSIVIDGDGWRWKVRAV